MCAPLAASAGARARLGHSRLCSEPLRKEFAVRTASALRVVVVGAVSLVVSKLSACGHHELRLARYTIPWTAAPLTYLLAHLHTACWQVAEQ